MSLEESENFLALIRALGARKCGGEYEACCPAHQDENPSFRMRQTSDGKILIHCFAGCPQETVISQLESKGLWTKENVANPSPTPPGIPRYWPTAAMLRKSGRTPSPENQKEYVHHWPYRDANGEIIGHVVRYERAGSKEVIPFFQRWPDNKWKSGHERKTGRSLYGLDLLAKFPDAFVLIVEGEKCAAVFNDLSPGENGLVAVTWPGGCKSYKNADWSPLHCRSVIFWPDNDVGGRGAMRGIAKLLEAVQ